jgi:hypothetical protein
VSDAVRIDTIKVIEFIMEWENSLSRKIEREGKSL